jgi:thiol-disulfide isomerase/thioredoxin
MCTVNRSPDSSSEIPSPSIRRAALCGLAIAICLAAFAGGSPSTVAAEPAPQKGKKSTPAADKSPRNDPAASKPDKDADKEAPHADEPEPRTAPDNPFPERVKAPELDGGTGWLNTGGEITLKDLRGKVVLLDFWTFCCINCMHVLPDLAFLEQKYSKELVVIGVHSAKFENEKDSENIRRAIVRYEISHPVINDSEMTVWRKFAVNSWPTLVLIDPEGYYCGWVSGEGNRAGLDAVIQKVIAYHRAKGTLDETPVRFDLEREKARPTPLKFPGKVLADETGRRLFISDSNHNRIVIASLDGKLIDVVGTGAIGKTDGAFDKASFDHPQGMALVGNQLFVADTENHLLRAVDLADRSVHTFAGTGKQGLDRRFGGDPLKTALNSPWDLVEAGGILYIAMAGPHQLWALDLKKHTLRPYAGSGREDILNGPLDQAALAQPSGITTDGSFLYVVDSEGSALRRVPLDSKGEITTVVGTSDLPQGQSLFAFGDRDGFGAEARLQHPLGIAYSAGVLYVADSYNHKIKKVDPVKDESRTFLGDGRPGDRENPPRFSEPAGLSVAGTVLYVADTNNHQIRKVDLQTGKVQPFMIDGLAPPNPVKRADDSTDGDGRKPTRVAAQRVAPGTLTFEADLHIPKGYKLNLLAPLSFRLGAAGDQSVVAAGQFGERAEIEAPTEGTTVKFAVPLAAKAGNGELKVTLSYGFCRDGAGGLCKLGTASWLVPIEVAADAKTTLIHLPAAKD